MDLIFPFKYQLVSIETLQYIQCMHYVLPLFYFVLLVDSLRCKYVEVWVVTRLKTNLFFHSPAVVSCVNIYCYMVTPANFTFVHWPIVQPIQCMVLFSQIVYMNLFGYIHINFLW